MKKTVKTLIRIEADGTQVYRKNNKEYRVASATKPAGFYAPFTSRSAMYKGRTDPRNTKWFAEAVRARRQQVGSMFRAVNPGPQHL